MRIAVFCYQTLSPTAWRRQLASLALSAVETTLARLAASRQRVSQTPRIAPAAILSQLQLCHAEAQCCSESPAIYESRSDSVMQSSSHCTPAGCSFLSCMPILNATAFEVRMIIADSATIVACRRSAVVQGKESILSVCLIGKEISRVKLILVQKPSSSEKTHDSSR